MLARPPVESHVARAPRPLSSKLREQLALCSSAPDRVLFLDIETTGLSHYYDEITLVGWSIDGRASTLIKGDDFTALREDAARAKVMVTFNGIRFDARFLRNEFPEIELPSAHIDLMYLCRRVGLTGGQKAIEKELGLSLRDGIGDVDGFAAVLLWHRYLRGEVEALKTLIRYNRADIAAMGAIFDHAVARLEVSPDLFATRVDFFPWAAPDGWEDVPEDLGLPKGYTSKPPGYEEILGSTPAASAKIVGIDLTGSEARGSGWCLLDGDIAETELLHSDEDILGRTITAKPDLVSIDSPLCLPTGRITVEDSDPGRERFGIMRECERELKRRGINVYPCLLPSMQKLTARGIRLAATLREQGIPVIESYPGAAQDIMRIPRKGAGIEWLQLGLTEFGVYGDLFEASHDELDAVTSALVGSFHWAGLSEALGTDEEPPLIIPKLDAGRQPLVIGVSGPIAAGKTTLSRALEQHGFAYTRFSEVIDDELRSLGKPLDRVSRQALGIEINREGRQRWLAERTLARVGGSPLVVVDGLRFPEDHAFLAERAGADFLHVFIDADEAKRRERYSARDGDGDFDVAAMSEVERQIEALRPLAHRVILNDGTKADIENWASELIAQVPEEKRCLSQS